MKGIYIIECLINGKKYVGCSKDVEKRISVQKGLLQSSEFRKRTVNKHLYADVQKYGWSNFEVEIIKLPKGKVLKDFEAETMVAVNSIYPDGYNLRRDIGGKYIAHDETKKLQSQCNWGVKNPNYGNHWSDEMKERMSIIKKRQHESGEIYTDEWRKKQGENSKEFWKNNPDKKLQMAEKVSKAKQKYRVIKCNMNGDEIETYESVKEAIEKNEGFRDIGIYNACNGYRKSYRGYKWKRQLKI